MNRVATGAVPSDTKTQSVVDKRGLAGSVIYVDEEVLVK